MPRQGTRKDWSESPQGAYGNRAQCQWWRPAMRRDPVSERFHVEGASTCEPSPTGEILHSLQLKLSQFREVPCSSVYLFELQGPQAVEAEFFNGEAAEHRAVDHRPA